MSNLFQSDSYLTKLTTTVVSCSQAKGGFAVVLKDTIIYAESGGQPSDYGTIAGLKVVSSAKAADGSITHLLEKPLETGGKVEVVLDWARRFDHMQQHTAQHLLTAVAQDAHGLSTTAFHLGAEKCDIEVDSPAVGPAVLKELESRVNELIRADLKVSCRAARPDEMAGLGVRSRGLPEGFSGLVRLVGIEGVDLNTCGGTHVSMTAELQAIKITGTEPMRGGTRIVYIAGGRVISALGVSIEREKELTATLSCGPSGHLAAVKKALDDAKSCSKALRAARLDLAGHAGAALAASGNPVVSHIPEADVEFLKALADAARKASPGMTILLTAGHPGAGVFFFCGPESLVAEVGPLVAAALEGRGGGGRGIFQGKAAKPENIQAALEVLKSRMGS
jgi:Ser-tRNA(Ala) deacylase AlaX